MSGVQSIAKRLVRSGIGFSAPVVWRCLIGPRLVILMYHRILPKGHPARSYEQAGMVVSPETLRMHLQALRRHFELVHLDDWVQKSLAGAQRPRLACAITFDDGWRDNYEFAFPVLREANAPATIYLVSHRVGGAYGFWPTRIAWGLQVAGTHGRRDVTEYLRQATGLDGLAGDDAIEWLKGRYDDARLQQLAGEIEALLGNAAPPDLMSWGQVDDMRASGLVRFGSHTCTHTRLKEGLDATVAAREISDSATELQKRLGGTVDGFCYPNGDYSDAAVEMVRGRYTYAVSTHHGWNDSGSDLALLKRVGVHDDVSDTPSKFLARLAMGI